MNNIQILNIILWQKNNIIRNLELKENSVNVITGDSGKGKSSILYIIDYCLLSSEAKGISKSNIDSKVTWYGLRLQINNKILTIARPAQETEETSRAYLSYDGDIPEIPTLSIKIENLKKVLNTSFGVNPELRIPYGGKFIKAGSKVSFRNFLAHCYQDQNTITSAEYLYMRPSDQKFQERIQRTFRMAVGIENEKSSLIKSKLLELEQKRITLQRKIEAYDIKRLAFSDEISLLADEAKAIGVLDETFKDPEKNIAALQEAITLADFPSSGTTTEALEKEIYARKSKIRKYKAFNQGRNSYLNTLKDAVDALRPIETINKNIDMIFPSNLTNTVVNQLQNELNKIRDTIKSKGETPFIREIAEAIKEEERAVLEIEETLRKTSGNFAQIGSPKDYYKYLGKLEAKIDLYSSKDHPKLETNESTIDEEISQLRAKLNEDSLKLDFILGLLNNLINEKLSRLKLKGYDGSTAIFSESEKLIHLITNRNLIIEKMPDIGSASNYLYLHLAYFLAIHEIAKIQEVSWMPSFLVLDQPSTPYFTTTGEKTDDIVSLDLALTEMNEFIKSMDQYGGFQIILLEHIEQSHWENLHLDRFNLVDKELRGSYGLILE